MAGNFLKSRSAAFLAVGAVSLSMGGCTPNANVVPEAISRLLTTKLTEQCERRSISVRAAAAGVTRAQKALNWFNSGILTDKRFQRVSQSSDSSGRQGVLSYKDEGSSYDVAWWQVDIPGIDVRDRLTIRTCIYVPENIQPIESSFGEDGTDGRIVFRENMRLSLFAQRMHDAGFLKTYGLTDGFEYVAEVRKNESGRWVVRSISLK